MRQPSILLLILSLYVARAVKNLRIVSPLKALTIWDPEAKEVQSTARGGFLPAFVARLKAEAEARRALADKKNRELQASATSGEDWAAQAASADRRRRQAEERFVERASDRAAKAAQQREDKSPSSPTIKNSNTYQFVGVVNPQSKETPIQWHARKKPRAAKWSVRLVHVDDAAVVTDLFRRGKVDIFAKYTNTGKVDDETNCPVINAEYSVKDRSLRNLWNFSPKHFFTDSSGMYWRERRMRPGMYTDGNIVYEASYRYRDGRNGMHRISTFQKYLGSKGVGQKQKEKITKRLKKDSPDLVLEE